MASPPPTTSFLLGVCVLSLIASSIAIPFGDCLLSEYVGGEASSGSFGRDEPTGIEKTSVCFFVYPNVGVGLIAKSISMEIDYDIGTGSLRVFDDLYGYELADTLTGTGVKTVTTSGQSLVVLTREEARVGNSFVANFTSSSETVSTRSIKFYYGLIISVLLPLVSICLLRTKEHRRLLKVKSIGTSIDHNPENLNRTQAIVVGVTSAVTMIVLIILLAV
eukprot:TRINITY_DN8849_c0_g1_i1.p1 TRINITY_DN8849_c0_g1~~TRINITY_DN8849_c0_g1_i1.p1  ORF type:complete len:220 (-),score=41.35 TRINITY_DN8849_c0_g1_i1:36-695(-)